jgi:uncharacterized repeat protein (TIGR01451 family)
MKLWSAAVCAVALTLAACGGGGGSGGGDSPAHVVDCDLVVTSTVPARTPAGTAATFTATVSNAGPDPATDVTITHALTAGYAPTLTCAASGGATCPATTGATMRASSIPAGGALTFSVAVPVAAGVHGTIASTLSATATHDRLATNDSATASTLTQDPHNGSYRVFATNGYEYALAVDIDAASYSMTGNGVNATGTFAGDGAGTFTIAGNGRFRLAPDLLVGGYDFGAGVTAFLAARRFVTAVGDLSGNLNTFGLNLPHGGTPDSQIYTARFASGTYQACYDAIIWSVGNCPAASLWTYTLSISGDVVTGVDSAHGETMTFRVAQSGGTLIFLRAGANGANDAQRFRIALPETSGLAEGTFLGSTTAGSWGTTTLTASHYGRDGVAAGGGALTDSASLHALGAMGPGGIMGGTRSSDSANVFVMESGPLAVLVGARGGPAAGYLELAVP